LCAKRLIASLRPTLHFFARGRDEAVKARQIVQGIVFAFEAGRDGFWLARWLRARGRRFLSKATFSVESDFILTKSEMSATRIPIDGIHLRPCDSLARRRKSFAV
jgi:hypothetical protein